MHRLYFDYIVRHKKAVYRAGRLLDVGIWQLITHDWSKFLPSEWWPYARYFYRVHPTNLLDLPYSQRLAWTRLRASDEADYEMAWADHLRRQPHHWQYWCVIQDDGGVKVLPMPDRYLREMIADWIGASSVQGNSLPQWYFDRRDHIRLHPETRASAERLMNEYVPGFATAAYRYFRHSDRDVLPRPGL